MTILCPKYVKTFTVTRTDPSTYDADGKLVPAAGSTFDIEASLQPVTGAQLQALPEGQHAANSRVLFTITPLRTRAPAGEPDTVDIAGETWEVVNVEHWRHFEEPYYRVRVARQDLP